MKDGDNVIMACTAITVSLCKYRSSSDQQKVQTLHMNDAVYFVPEIWCTQTCLGGSGDWDSAY